MSIDAMSFDAMSLNVGETHFLLLEKLKEKSINFLKSKGISTQLLQITETESRLITPFSGDAFPLFKIEPRANGFVIIEDEAIKHL